MCCCEEHKKTKKKQNSSSSFSCIAKLQLVPKIDWQCLEPKKKKKTRTQIRVPFWTQA
jgi:hypothetical protein